MAGSELGVKPVISLKTRLKLRSVLKPQRDMTSAMVRFDEVAIKSMALSILIAFKYREKVMPVVHLKYREK